MFEYELPCGGLCTSTYYDEEGQIRFAPAVQSLRHTTTIRIIEDEKWNHHFRKVADFGCSQMSLIFPLKNTKNIQHILEIDIDEDLLQSNKRRAEPLISDYVSKRTTPLLIEVLRGSISVYDKKLCGTDVVICLEVIEHLEANVLEKVPETIFGCVQPKLAIFSTPNSEFNVLFGQLLENGFRHLDHKFEWNRAEFQKWSSQICDQYPNYEYSILGLGKAPSSHPNIGEVTQMAIFARKDILGKDLIHDIVETPTERTALEQYKEISINDFPIETDERSIEEKIIDEANYVIQLSRFTETYFNEEENVWQIPMRMVYDYGKKIACEKEKVLEILQNHDFVIQNDFFILPAEEEFEGDINLDPDSDNECNDGNKENDSWLPLDEVPEENWDD